MAHLLKRTDSPPRPDEPAITNCGDWARVVAPKCNSPRQTCVTIVASLTARLIDRDVAWQARWILSASVIWLVAETATPALAQQPDDGPGVVTRLRTTTPAGVSTPSDESAGFWRQTGEGVKRLWADGEDDLFVPGYIWHAPWHYSGDRVARYNTLAWGLGYGRTLVAADGHPRTLFAIVSADSFARPQYMAGYAWRARWRPGGGVVRLGGGYTALVIGRFDKLHYAPLPVALPLASVGTDRFEIFGAYVPGFEVGYFFAKVRIR